MRNKRVVTIGGGTGSFTILQGLKKYPFDISAIVSMADDGGSTGVLRDELGVLPPGDVRQCLVALSQSSQKMRELMNYRFENGGLKGHSFGNLFLSALEKIEGSFTGGVRAAMDILNVRGEVIPVTEGDARLVMALRNGVVLSGENEINHAEHIDESGIERYGFERDVSVNPDARSRILDADMIVIGPGNFYCSLLPNLLVEGCVDAIRRSSARLVFVSNLTNKRGHTSGWDIDDFVRELERFVGSGRVDFVIWNALALPAPLLEKYEIREGPGAIVGFFPERERARTFRVVRSDIVSDQVSPASPHDAVSSTRAFIRHDPDRLAQVIVFLLNLDSERKGVIDIV